MVPMMPRTEPSVTRTVTPLEADARLFAIAAHGDQKYGDSGLPYSVHLAHVVAVLETHDVIDPRVLAAGWLRSSCKTP